MPGLPAQGLRAVRRLAVRHWLRRRRGALRRRRRSPRGGAGRRRSTRDLGRGVASLRQAASPGPVRRDARLPAQRRRSDQSAPRLAVRRTGRVVPAQLERAPGIERQQRPVALRRGQGDRQLPIQPRLARTDRSEDARRARQAAHLLLRDDDRQRRWHTRLPRRDGRRG